MEKKEILGLSAVALASAIKEGKTTAPGAVQAVLEQIEETEKKYHCYVTIDAERAMKTAIDVQNKIKSGELTGPLAGVPMAVKDNLCTEGLLTTCSSKMLGNFVPAYTAEAVLRLQKAGAILIGKTNMDEFAMGSTTETSAYGVTRNPRNPEHVPGGSSGGSAAAVAANECFFALGSDTGGSVRQPASHCGVVGMKPTYGTVSRYGLIAYASSMDQIGPLCRTVEDCAAILEVISGHDEKDSTSLIREDTNFTKALIPDCRGMKIGIPKDYLGEGLDLSVKKAIQGAAGILQKNGAVVEYFDLGLTEYAVPAYYTIAAAEASSNLERYDGIKYGYRKEQEENLQRLYRRSRSAGFGAEVKRRIMLGSFVLSSGYYEDYYLKALKVKSLIKSNFDRTFQTYDCILGPVAPTTAPRLGESLTDPIEMYLGDVYTISANLAGLPGIGVPCGADDKGLPIGLQLLGNSFQEKKLLQIAYAFEQRREG